MSETKSLEEQVHKEFERFKKTMEELTYLKSLSSDLRTYRRMIKIKRYD